MMSNAMAEEAKNETANIQDSEQDGKSLNIGTEIPEPTTKLAKVGYKMPPVEHRFKPGQVGNPGGKPKTKHIRDAALKIGSLDPEKLETYKPKTVFEEMVINAAKVMRNPSRNSSAAIAAFNALADRIDGKPKPSDEELDSNQNKNILVIPSGLMGKQPTEE
jgi:hypothetical protein